MRLLPILVRELRVLCRKRGTYGMRLALAFPVLATGALFTLDYPGTGGDAIAAQAAVCQILFAFGAAFAASDSISSERREGTLGLLLLTPLRSYQVLLGKLLTRISQFLLCLWAVVPILSLPLLAGGVDPADVAWLIAGILAGCLLGMAIGLCASVLCKSAVASACLSFAFLLGLYIVPPVVGEIVVGIAYNLNFYWWGPIAAILESGAELTLNLAILGGLTLSLILFSQLIFSIAWILERRAGGTIPVKEAASRQAPVHPAIGDLENPPRVLHSRYHRRGIFYRIGTVILLLPCLTFFIFYFHELLTGTLVSYFASDVFILYIFGFPLMSLAYLKASLDAPSLIYEDRKTGMLELLLIAPLSRVALLRGLRHPVGTQLIWNRSMILSLHLLAILMLCCLAWREWTVASGVSEIVLDSLILVLAHIGCVLTLPVELLSIRNLGIWLGLKTERPLKASLLIFLIHFVAPAILLPVILILAEEFQFWGWRDKGKALILSLILWHLLRLLVSAWFWIWSESRLRVEFLAGR